MEKLFPTVEALAVRMMHRGRGSLFDAKKRVGTAVLA